MDLSIEPTTAAAADARQSLLAWTDELDRRSLSNLRTVVSELVALSVVRGAAAPIDLHVELDDGEARGRLADMGHAATAVEAGGAGGEESWALRIVDDLVDDWGTDGKPEAVWFRMPVGRVEEV